MNVKFRVSVKVGYAIFVLVKAGVVQEKEYC